MPRHSDPVFGNIGFPVTGLSRACSSCPPSSKPNAHHDGWVNGWVNEQKGIVWIKLAHSVLNILLIWIFLRNVTRFCSLQTLHFSNMKVSSLFVFITTSHQQSSYRISGYTPSNPWALRVAVVLTAQQSCSNLPKEKWLWNETFLNPLPSAMLP